jgi:ComF family protein
LLDKFKIALIDLLFPPYCVACRRLGAWLCPACLAKIESIHPPICQRCGLPSGRDQAANPGMLICSHCQRAPLQLDGLLAYAYHSGPLREAIHQFKYEDLRSLAGPLGKLMHDGWTMLAPPNLEIDTIVPVPLHPARQRQRGYNQSVLLARELGVALARPVVEGVLIRTKATAPQVGLNALERRTNVQDAFQCVGSALSGKRVLLVDDVCTTGCTLESACLALRASGASSVWAYTLARARPDLHDFEHKPF